MNGMNKLNHFTTYDVLLKILSKGLKFSGNFDGWEDKNDSSLVKIYQNNHTEEKIGVICFLNDDETFYHWTYFKGNCSKRDICCIEFDKSKLLSKVNSKTYYRGIVSYEEIDKVQFNSARDLLFKKRYPYRNEKEYRIVNRKLNDSNEYIRVDDSIKKITMSGELSFEEFCERKSYLEKTYGITCVINHSTVFENKNWIMKAENKSYDVVVKETKDVLNDCYRNIWSLVESGKAVDMQFFDGIWRKQTIVASITVGNEIAACGALKDATDSHKEDVFKKAESQEDCNHYKYELGWIVTANSYQRNGLCGMIVDKLLEKNGEQPIYATVREDNCKMRVALEKRGFCITGHKYKTKRANEDYYLFLYVRS